MDELQDLRAAIEAGDYPLALSLIDELDELSRDDKINKIVSYMEVLFEPLIKQAVHGYTTRSWDDSIAEAVAGIRRTNKHRQSGGHSLNALTLDEAMAEAWPGALRRAAREALGGDLSPCDLAARVDWSALAQNARTYLEQGDRP